MQKFGDEYVALTELSKAISFDPKDLSTLGDYGFKDKLNMVFSTAHPHFDFEKKKIYNVGIKTSFSSTYIIYEINPINKTRKVLTKINCISPSYTHSFAMTQDYIVFAEYSMKINPFELLITTKPISHTIYFEESRPVKFHIIDKNTGKITKVFETEPTFAFHHVNAYQKGEEIILDAITSKNKNIFQDLTFENIYNPDSFRNKIKTSLERFRLSLSTGKVENEILFKDIFEFPNLNYLQNNSKDYRFSYGTSFKDSNNCFFWDSLIKVDLKPLNSLKWDQEDCYVNEPFFVTNPESESEDDGIILSLILDAHQKKSFLLFLDALTFEEIARVYVPHIIPYSLHGQFFR